MSPTLGAPLSMAEMTWTQMQEAMNDGIRNVIFAVGATEQHGPHLPLSTDTLIGTATSLAVATRIGGRQWWRPPSRSEFPRTTCRFPERSLCARRRFST